MGTCCSSQHSEGTSSADAANTKPTTEKYTHKDAPEKIPTVHASQRVFPPRGRAASESYIPSSVPIAAIRLIDEHGKQHTQVVLNPTALKHADEMAQSQNGTNNSPHHATTITSTTTNTNTAEAKTNGDTSNNTTNNHTTNGIGMTTASSSASASSSNTNQSFTHTHVTNTTTTSADSSLSTATTNTNNNNTTTNKNTSSSSDASSSASRSSPEAVPTVGILFHESENSSSGSPILNSNAVNRLDDPTSPISDRRNVAESSFNAVSSLAELVDVALQEQSPAVPATATSRPLTVSP